MKKGRHYAFIILLISTVFPAFAHINGAESHLHVCGDAIDWPPYTYIDGNEVKGEDIDILGDLLPKLGYSFDITMTSWTRCLRGTKTGDFQLAVSASFNTEREKHYLYTTWYYEITPYYVYSSKRFPQGLTINEVSDLEQYKVCGIHGYNYSDFQLNNVDQYTVNTFESITELKKQHCDVFLSWDEILSGIKRVWGIDYIQGNIVAKPIPNMQKHKFYMLISKQFPQAQALQTALNDALSKHRNTLD
tara:strand:+ start:995 stop:1735 length:741 start_codon:yes stop_codon:yes gene_type:complete